jgi:hypothetical protein
MTQKAFAEDGVPWYSSGPIPSGMEPDSACGILRNA